MRRMTSKTESAVRKELRTPLKSRKSVKKKKPGFSRQEGYRHARLKDSWRRPRGRHSKLRKGEKARGSRPSPGYGSPAATRGLTRQGYREVRVSTVSELEHLNPKEDAVLIASSVGKKKREEILRKADEMKIRISNQRSRLNI